MERLWGEIVPVPEANVKPLSGGERVLGMRVAYTPGHASHHVCYLHEESGTAFIGDVAASADPGLGPGRPPHAAARHRRRDLGGLDSAIVESWKPERLALTHFGAIDDPVPHLALVRERLREEAQLARELSEDDYERQPPRPRRRTRRSTEAAEELIQCVPPQYQWRGLDRYWRKRANAGAPERLIRPRRG